MSSDLSFVAESVQHVLASRGVLKAREYKPLPSVHAARPVSGSRTQVTGLLPPTVPNLKATPAQRLLCAVGDWAENGATAPVAVSNRARLMVSYGYKHFGLLYPNGGSTFLALRASGSDAVELHTIISYPDRRGNGSATLNRLVRLADELKVTIWLEAHPFGRDREHIPQQKLIAFYRHFGFFSVRGVNPAWMCGYHRWDGFKPQNPMLRNPVSSS